MTAQILDAIQWQDGLVLRPEHFQHTDRRNALLAHVAALIGDPWPWGFVSFQMDATALAAGRLRVHCSGVFPDGDPFRQDGLSLDLPEGKEGEQKHFLVTRGETGGLALQEGEDAPGARSLPAARLVHHNDVWNGVQGWSPPAIVIQADHPMREDVNQQLGALAALAAGFTATLRLPGADVRPVARVIRQVAGALIQGVGVMEALLASPAVSPGRLGIEAVRLALGVRGARRLGIEAVRLALGVRGAVGVFESLGQVWDASDQRGSLRRLLYMAESAVSGIGLPFRASMFRPVDDSDMLVVDGIPADNVLLAVEASRPNDLVAAQTWLAGAALASPERIQEALTRRVEGCRRYAVDRDAQLGVSSGPLLALYRVSADVAWRGSQTQLALAARTQPPPNTTFSVLVVEDSRRGGAAAGAPELQPGTDSADNAAANLRSGWSRRAGHGDAM